MSNLHARTIARARKVAALHRDGLTLDVIAHRLGVTPRSATRYHAIARNLPKEPTVPNTKGWGQRGLCRNEDPTWWFPDNYSNRTPQVKAAKNVCRSCPVQAACRTYALDNPDQTRDGIWGGLTPRERDRARKAAQTEGIAA